MSYTTPYIYLGMKMNRIYQDKQPYHVFTFTFYYRNQIKIRKAENGKKWDSLEIEIGQFNGYLLVMVGIRKDKMGMSTYRTKKPDFT
jgi:hypothetical protein